MASALTGLPITAASALFGVSAAAEVSREGALNRSVVALPGETESDRQLRVAGAIAGGIQIPEAGGAGGWGALGRWFSSGQKRTPATDQQWSADMAQMMGYGWTKAQAAGLLGGYQRESSGDATAVGDNGLAYGVGQWHPDRQADFARVFGHDIRNSTHAEQIAFGNWELHNTQADAGRRLAATTTDYQSAYVASKYFERPADPTGTEALIRGQNADRMMALGPALTLPANVGTAANPGGASPIVPNGQVAITARFANAPAGMTTTAVQSGDGLAPLRVERSTVGRDLETAGY